MYKKHDRHYRSRSRCRGKATAVLDVIILNVALIRHNSHHATDITLATIAGADVGVLNVVILNVALVRCSFSRASEADVGMW